MGKYKAVHEVSPWDASHRIILIESIQPLNSYTSPWYPSHKQAILETKEGDMFMSWNESNCPRGLVPNVVYEITKVEQASHIAYSGMDGERVF